MLYPLLTQPLPPRSMEVTHARMLLDSTELSPRHAREVSVPQPLKSCSRFIGDIAGTRQNAFHENPAVQDPTPGVKSKP